MHLDAGATGVCVRGEPGRHAREVRVEATLLSGGEAGVPEAEGGVPVAEIAKAEANAGFPDELRLPGLRP